MYLEHFQLHTSPFREKVDTDVFFLEAGRDTICRGVHRELSEGRLLVKLIGTEGTGKTLVCKVLCERLPDAMEIVYLDNPKGSFDDLLRIVCLDLGLQAVDEQVDLVEELKRQLDRRVKYGRKVVLVLDSAETIFLATLERLLRLVCELKEQSSFALVLAGRPALDVNLEQLTVYCTGVEIHTGFCLEPMTLEETGHYLNFRLHAAGLRDDEPQEVFAKEAVEKIYATAKGNPRLTNILAEEALQRSCSDKSFMVLLDHVDAEIDPVSPERKKLDLRRSNQWKKRLLGLGAGLAILLLILFFFLPRKEEPKRSALPHGSPSVADDLPAGKHGALKPDRKNIQTGSGSTDQVSDVQRVPSLSSGRADEQIAAAGSSAAAGNQEQGQDDTSGARNGEKLFHERLRASAGWLAGAYRGQFTIQLMMLSSDQAPSNVKKLLVQDQYFAIKDNMYILHKQTNPPTLFVFYGTFGSMQIARQARNQLPIFLRKHHPYALSIADALTKTED